MGCGPSSSVTTIFISNDYDRTVYAKIDQEKQYVTSRQYKVGANVEACEVGVGVEVEGAEEWDWSKIEAEFTRIPIKAFQTFEIQSMGSKQVYITVMSDSGKILCESLPRFKLCNMIVALSGNLCEAKEGSRWEYAYPDQAGVRSVEAPEPGEESRLPRARNKNKLKMQSHD